MGMFWGNLQVSFLIVNTFNLNLNTLFCVILRQLSASTDFFLDLPGLQFVNS